MRRFEGKKKLVTEIMYISILVTLIIKIHKKKSSKNMCSTRIKKNIKFEN